MAFDPFKEVRPALFLSLFAMGLRRLVWVMLMKPSFVCLLMLSHSAFMDHSESVLIWSLVLLGVSFRAIWMVRSSAELFDWIMFFPTGALTFLGSLGPNQMPVPTFAILILSLLRLHEPSVKAVVLGRSSILGLHLTESSLCFLGLVMILKFSWIL